MIKGIYLPRRKRCFAMPIIDAEIYVLPMTSYVFTIIRMQKKVFFIKSSSFYAVELGTQLSPIRWTSAMNFGFEIGNE